MTLPFVLGRLLSTCFTEHFGVDVTFHEMNISDDIAADEDLVTRLEMSKFV